MDKKVGIEKRSRQSHLNSAKKSSPAKKRINHASSGKINNVINPKNQREVISLRMPGKDKIEMNQKFQMANSKFQTFQEKRISQQLVFKSIFTPCFEF
ncbi:MAG: hypothetical protein IPG07_06815 [Crocinitomicaceae bacterium]|nr:hypothetical protein [Crocinitomicaceae bacterium]